MLRLEIIIVEHLRGQYTRIFVPYLQPLTSFIPLCQLPYSSTSKYVQKKKCDLQSVSNEYVTLLKYDSFSPIILNAVLIFTDNISYNFLELNIRINRMELWLRTMSSLLSV